MSKALPATANENAASHPAVERKPSAMPDYLPARMLHEFAYCPRVFYYEWVDGVFVHSVDTVAGALRHEKLETREDELPPPHELVEGESRSSRSVELASERLKVIARMDLVEISGGVVVPVDYKKGRPRDEDDGPAAWPADRAQVGVQALILRDNGYRCDEAVLFYNTTRQRVRVPIDDALVAEIEATIAAARETAAAGVIPPPLQNSPKCPRCSLVTYCLPDETALATREPEEEPRQLSLFGPPPIAGDDGEARRLVPARDDLRPLYVTGHGLSIGLSGEVLEVREPAKKRGERSKKIQEVRINEISQLNVFGNAQLSSAAVRALCWAEKPISYYSYGGWFYGMTQGIGLKNVFVRREQFRRADDPWFCLRLARSFVASKIRNQRTLLQRNHIEPPELPLLRMKRLAEQAREVTSLDELLGIEGSGARFYFANFAGMIKVDEPLLPAFDFQGRNRRPPRDPVNALLSFAYSLLAKDLTSICHAIGLDPFLGFFHQPRFGRPGLALDLMEEFRPLIADSAVVSAINNGMIGAEEFLRVGDACTLTPKGRNAFIRAYEQRIDTLVTHPLFGYRVSYRRVMEIQARLLARLLTGELDHYRGFETR